MTIDDLRNMDSDQRIYPRICPKEMIFAVVGYPPILVGRIIDISVGGLAFRYLNDLELERKEYTVGILKSGKGLRVSDLPCRKIYDFLEPLSEGYRNFNKTFRMKCCGLAFENLTDDETIIIERFIGWQRDTCKPLEYNNIPFYRVKEASF